MLVRQKIGPNAGKIVDMPYQYAVGCIQAGTADVVEEADIGELKANTVPTVGYAVSAAESFPAGYTAEQDPEYGYIVRDQGGAPLNGNRPFPNLAAARSFAHEYATAQMGIDPEVARAAIEHRVAMEKQRAEEEEKREETFEKSEAARRAMLGGGVEGDVSPTGAGARPAALGPKPADDRGTRDRVPPVQRGGGTDGPKPAGRS